MVECGVEYIRSMMIVGLFSKKANKEEEMKV